MRRAVLAQHPNNKGVTIIEFVVVASVFLLIIGALTPFVNMARARSSRLYCAENLRKLSLGLHSYAANHNETFPAELRQLYPQYVDSEKVFNCPAVNGKAAKEKTDYKYIFGLTESSPPKEIIIEDLDGNHKKNSKNILRLDGSIEWIDGRN